jgi:hypothetical protein
MEKQIGSIEIVKYRCGLVHGEPKIIIEMVKLLDEDGKYIKFAKMVDVVGILCDYPVIFKKP